ncbi:hypothetical protein ASJ81_07400 [Methanosarcina spelaei]|uniref:Transmembrane protein n=1 Tax=Methanosarcina spelaei TaxID=1036679 RepID=A0A2A2HS07_9EURY|nr:hypothetical protein ASJ81_07400 [Methanosarcina spelaei]
MSFLIFFYNGVKYQIVICILFSLVWNYKLYHGNADKKMQIYEIQIYEMQIYEIQIYEMQICEIQIYKMQIYEMETYNNNISKRVK